MKIYVGSLPLVGALQPLSIDSASERESVAHKILTKKCTSFKACVVLTCKAIKIMMRRRSLKLFLVAPVR